jgi:amino acid transporter
MNDWLIILIAFLIIGSSTFFIIHMYHPNLHISQTLSNIIHEIMSTILITEIIMILLFVILSIWAYHNPRGVV